MIVFFVLQVCHLRQTFKPTAESCIFVHIILQETEECKMWPKFVNIRLYKYGYSQVKLREMGWNNKEILLKINM
jgi:hypothetical protein